MKKIFIILSLFLGACTAISPVVCDLEKQAGVGLASGVMSFCTCTDPVAVSTWLISKIPASLNLCPKEGKAGSIIGDMVCSPVINGLAGSACRQIPSCSGAMPTNAQIQAAITLCKSKI